LTDTGKVILRGTFFVALAATIVPAFGILSALVSIMVTALAVGFFLRPKIHIEGNLPERVVTGQTTIFGYKLKNTSRLPAYNLRVEFSALPDAIEQVAGGEVIGRLGPGETAEVTVAMKPCRRGYYRITKPVCRSSFPFNMFDFSTSGGNAETLIVLANYYRLQFSLSGMSQNVCAGGARLVGERRAFPEYAGNRPFLPGDSPRRIDARAWARLSVPATKEYHDDFDKRAALILDTRVRNLSSSPNTQESREFEAAVSFCASAAFTINNDCLIDVLCAGSEIYELSSLSRMMRLDKIHDVLAGVECSKRESIEKAAPALISQLPRISDVLFILLSWNKEYRRLIEAASQAGCNCNVFAVSKSGQIHLDEDEGGWKGNLKLLSVDEILTGELKRL
jgi:uncharacterized protein (DUF58 family)